MDMKTELLQTVVFGGLTYRLPFAGLTGEPSANELIELRRSIQEHGVRVRVMTYNSPTHGQRCVIDGAWRLRIAAQLGLAAIPVQACEATDEEAEQLAYELNRARKTHPDNRE